MKKFVYSLIACLVINIYSLNAQDAINLTQYTSGISIINPAYSGITGRFTAQFISRNQWVGIEGAPKSYALLVNSPITKYNVGLGGILIYEKIGNINKYGFSINTAYNFKLNEKINISFGLKSIIALYNFDYIGDELVDLGDPYFQNVKKISPSLNFGAGLYIYSNKFYFGYSVTPLMRNRIRTLNNPETEFYEINQEINHYLSGAYSFNINEEFILRPSFLLKTNNNLMYTCDLSLTCIYKDKFWIGTTYRTSKMLSLFTQLQVSEKLRIGYAYDFGVSKTYSLNSGSHELFIAFDIQLVKKKFITPRYF